ncbi:MAG: hypothetical protein WC721_18045, partial [Victivallaceae bacterium]
MREGHGVVRASLVDASNVMLNDTPKSCMMYLLRFHYSLRDREPKREAQEGAEKRNSGNLRILCH